MPSEAYAVLGLASGGLVYEKKIKEVGMSSVAYLRQLGWSLSVMRAALMLAKQALES